MRCWAPAFGERAPRLIARDTQRRRRRLIVSELQGTVLERTTLSPEIEEAVWFEAGRALAALHALPSGESFGSPARGGRCVPDAPRDAVIWVEHSLDEWVERGRRTGCLTTDELAVVDAARPLLPAFADERPIPCHRDYCPANWLVDDAGRWVGVIDFEFSRWDVRAFDFVRHPDWDYIERPRRVEALLAGYGRAFSEAEERQRLVAHVHYALTAIVWGHEANFLGFKGRGAARYGASRAAAQVRIHRVLWRGEWPLAPFCVVSRRSR